MSQSNLQMFRKFILQRNQDVSGNTGTGTVAEGIQFTNGKCAISFLPDLKISGIKNVEVFDSIDDVITIHGHEGKTEVVWIDNKPDFTIISDF